MTTAFQQDAHTQEATLVVQNLTTEFHTRAGIDTDVEILSRLLPMLGDLGERKRMAQWDQIGGPLGTLDPCNARNGEDVAGELGPITFYPNANAITDANATTITIAGNATTGNATTNAATSMATYCVNFIHEDDA